MGRTGLSGFRKLPGSGILQSKSPAETGGKMDFVSLKSDYAFRALFGHEGVRKQFISDVTGIPLESYCMRGWKAPSSARFAVGRSRASWMWR